jgi:hypothetical protein
MQHDPLKCKNTLVPRWQALAKVKLGDESRGDEATGLLLAAAPPVDHVSR